MNELAHNSTIKLDQRVYISQLQREIQVLLGFIIDVPGYTNDVDLRNLSGNFSKTKPQATNTISIDRDTRVYYDR